MAIFAFFTGLLMFFFINEPLVVETYGLVALVTESLLASPQFYRNFKSKSTEGMRFVTVALALLYTLIIIILPFQPNDGLYLAHWRSLQDNLLRRPRCAFSVFTLRFHTNHFWSVFLNEFL